ncbi:tetratricopeptide repeat protein [Spirulina major CS-329]|uniref:CHAT domain-containing protein n=1 Tax=Spirulina TaxID=1154 RepID=UPI002330AF6D|nr:tetratricopeptide repeat protein [Spirulina major]MDB9501646.1 tetratricopeptide repeat protein [Spirulina major CS-329]
MRLSTKVWGSLIAPLLIFGLPGGVTGLDGGAVAQTPYENLRNAGADRLRDRGAEQLQSGNYQAALELLQQAYTAYKETENLDGLIRTSLMLGYTYGALGEAEQAHGIFQGLLDLAVEIEFQWLEEQARQGLLLLQLSAAVDSSDPELTEANHLFQQGTQQGQTGQFRVALQSFEQALVLYHKLGDRQREANTLNSLGEIHRNLGHYQQATEFYQQSLEIKRELGDQKGEALSLVNLGNIYHHLSEYEQALHLYQQSLDIAQQIEDQQGESNALGSLGIIYFSLGDYERAIAFHHQSLAINQEIGDRQGEAKNLSNLGLTYHSLSEYERAIALYQQSFELERELENSQGQASSLANLGNAYFSLGQYRRAIALYQQSFEIQREIGDRMGEATNLGNLGIAHHFLGQYERAIPFLQQYRDLAQELGDQNGEGNALGNLGIVYWSLGEYEHAIEFFQQTLEIDREIGDRQGEVTSLSNLGLTHNSLGQYERAIAFHEESLEIAQELKDRQVKSTSFHNLGFALLNLDRAPEAEQQLLAAAELKEAIRADVGNNDTNQVSLFDQQTSTYALLQRAQIAQNKTIAALETAERGRARAFVELLHRRLNPDDPNATIAPPNLAQIQQIAKEQNATLVEYSIIYDEFDLDDNPGKEATRESALYIWVIAPSGEVTFRQVDLTPLWRDDKLRLDDLVQCTRDSLGVRGLDLRTLNRLIAVLPRNEGRRQCFDDDFLLPKLHELLIAPIADLLPTDPEDRVVFLPQSSLFLVPFPALMDANGNYLIEKHTILTAPSIQTLELTRSQKETQSRGHAVERKILHPKEFQKPPKALLYKEHSDIIVRYRNLPP